MATTQRIFKCTEAFAAHMHRRRKFNVSVEVAQSNHSDFEVTEIYLRLLGDRIADELINKKQYRVYPLETPDGEKARVLFAPYVLTIDEVVTFDHVKSFGIIGRMKVDGVRL